MAGQGVMCTDMGSYLLCSAQMGTEVTLYCNVDANPPAMVTFSPLGVNPVGNNIVIPSFSAAANYSCTANNEGFDPVTRNFRVVLRRECCMIDMVPILRVCRTYVVNKLYHFST